MKKGTIILWLVMCVPLLCLAAQWCQPLSANDRTTEPPCYWEQPEQQSPLEPEREYTTNDMWCLCQALTSSSHATKWQESSAGNATSHTTYSPLSAASGHTSSHPSFPNDGCSVIIRLHHLII